MVSALRKELAKHALSVFGGRPIAKEYLNDNGTLKVDVLSADNDSGIISYSTIGVFEVPLRMKNGAESPRIELCGTFMNKTKEAAKFTGIVRLQRHSPWSYRKARLSYTWRS